MTETQEATELETSIPGDEMNILAPSPPSLPDLTKAEQREVQRRTPISAIIVHETVREEGERELRRAPYALAWSGLAAGLSMGFSLVAQGLLRTYLPNMAWRPLVSNFGYSLGFLIVILGRQQLFTENTLTVILPVLAHPNRDTFGRVARLWSIVLLANLSGAFIFAIVIAHTQVFPPNVLASFQALGTHAAEGGFGLTVLRGIFAGWLIALMVWLLPAAETSRMHIIMVLTYIVGLGGFAHVIAGSVEVLFSVNVGALPWQAYCSFLVSTLLGNIIGGISLVAALNYAQVAAEISN